MNPEPTPTPREQTEMRLTALLMGELSAEETVALHAQIAADPGLARLHARLRQAMALLREATAEPEPATPTPAQLSSERRERLLAYFQNPAPQPAKPAPIVKAPRRNWSWVVPLGAAAAVVVILAGLLFPAVPALKTSSKRGGFAVAPAAGWSPSMGAAQSREIVKNRLEGEVPAGAAYGHLYGYTTLEPGEDFSADTLTKSGTGSLALAPAEKSKASALYLPPTTDAPVAGERDAVAKTNEPALPVLGDIPVLGSLFRDGQGTSPALDLATNLGSEGEKATGLRQGQAVHDDQVQAQNHRAASDRGATRNFEKGQTLQGRTGPAVEPALPAADFDGSVTFGSAIAPTPADPAAPAPRPEPAAPSKKGIEVVREFNYRTPIAPPEKPAPQSGKDARNKGDLAASQAGGDKQLEIEAKHVEITQNNLQELSFDDLAGGERAKANLKTAADGTIRDEPSGPRRPADKEEGDKLKSSKAQKAPPPIEVGADVGEGSEGADAAGEGAGEGQSEGQGKTDAVPRMSRDLAKLKDRAADPFGYIDGRRSEQPALEPADVLPAPAPPPLPSPPSSVPLPVVTAPVGEETAIEMLFKTIDEMKPLGGGQAGTGKGGKEAATRPETEALKSDLAKDTAQREKVATAWANPVRKLNVPPATPAPAREQLQRGAKKSETSDAKAAPAAEPLSKLEKKADQPAKPAEEQKLKEVDNEVPAARPAQPAAIPQPEVATSANAFSTFSLNVSDVSFKLAGASLEKGQMPELATVRSEEFINAFDYRDPEPAAGAPLAFATERARYPFAQNRDLVRFSVKTAAAGRQPGRPLNLVLLLDNSGSMERADRVRILREALRVLAAQLQPQDRLSVVAFARTPRLWADGVTGDKAGAAVARVGEITPQGGTNLEAALDLGYATALKHYQPGSISRVVLLTDGAANLGDVNPDALKRKVETNRQRGVALDCFGIGWEGYDDTLLETLARNGDGRYGFINTPEEAASGFAAQLAGALRVATSDVKVQVEWNPRRVTAYRQIGYAKHQLKKEQFRDNTVDAAEIGAAESGNALYVVEVNPRGEGDLATVRVRFKVPGTSDYKEHEWAVPFTPNASALEQASPALRLAGTASAFSEWLVASPYAAEVTPDRLLGLLNGVPAIYPADPRPKKLEWMIRTAKSVSGR